MKRIKITRVKKLIQDCQYWKSCEEFAELFEAALAKLIEAAGEDHPLVVDYLKTINK
jgi:hypothetical protein